MTGGAGGLTVPTGTRGGATDCLLGCDHVLWAHPLVKLLVAAVAQRQRGSLQGGALLVGLHRRRRQGSGKRQARRWTEGHRGRSAQPPTAATPFGSTATRRCLGMRAAQEAGHPFGRKAG